MDLVFKSQDFLCLLIIPIMFFTARQVKENWSSLWDDDVTNKDRRILLQGSLFLLEPLIVLCHELGHAGATIYFGGKVVEFHFAILSGYVVPEGVFSPAQLLAIYLAGNAVQILLGYLCLFGALLVRSPAVVAVLVYLGLWSIASSAVFYALMSLLGFYGDWIAIYTSPVEPLVVAVALCHALVIVSLAYIFMGRKPRLWFASKTRPSWAARYKQQLAVVAAGRSKENLLALAWLCYEASLNEFAKDYARSCLELDASDPEPFVLLGFIELNKLRFDKAEAEFAKITSSQGAGDLLKARAYMYIAQSRLTRAEVERRDPAQGQGDALECLSAACAVAPHLGDARIRRAVVLNKLRRFSEARADLLALSDPNFDWRWLDRALPSRIAQELKIADQGG